MAPVRAGKARPGEGTGREGLEEEKFRRAELPVHFPPPSPPSTTISHRAVNGSLRWRPQAPDGLSGGRGDTPGHYVTIHESLPLSVNQGHWLRRWFPTGGHPTAPRDIRQCLETVLGVTTVCGGCYGHPVGLKPGVLLNAYSAQDRPPQQSVWPQTSQVSGLKNPLPADLREDSHFTVLGFHPQEHCLPAPRLKALTTSPQSLFRTLLCPSLALPGFRPRSGLCRCPPATALRDCPRD